MTIPAGPLRLLHKDPGSGPKYGSLLLILIVTYVLSAFTVAGLVSAVQVVLFLAVVLIALRSGRLQRMTVRLIAVGLLLGSVVSVTLQLVDNQGDGGALASLWTALILTLAVFFIVRQVLSQPQITEQSIFGVLSAYMMIGLIFAAIYVAMWKFSPHPPFFAHGAREETTKTFQYFSFTTLTTLGYGDFTAAGDGGRAIAVLEAMIGQMFLATLVARLVAGFRWSDRAAGRHTSPQAALPPPGSGQPVPGQPRAVPASPAGAGPSSPARAVPASPGPSRAKKSSAAGLIRLNPPGAVRGRGTGLRRGGRNGTGGSDPVPAARPADPD